MVQPVNPAYTRHHPRWYRRRMPIFWWVGTSRYLRFILRELTSLFVAYAAVLLLAQWWAVARGPEAAAALAEWLRRPGVIAFHAFVLVALAFHSVTWLGLAPRALVLRVAGRPVPARAVLLGHYAAWLGVSAAVLWLLAGG